MIGGPRDYKSILTLVLLSEGLFNIYCLTIMGWLLLPWLLAEKEWIKANERNTLGRDKGSLKTQPHPFVCESLQGQVQWHSATSTNEPGCIGRPVLLSRLASIATPRRIAPVQIVICVIVGTSSGIFSCRGIAANLLTNIILRGRRMKIRIFFGLKPKKFSRRFK